jgi:hypothetical protein
MSDIRIVTGVETPSRVTGDGQFLGVRGLRDGALVSADWKMALALEGRVFHAGAGIDMTAITSVAFDQDRPDFWLSIPASTTILPLRVEVAVMSQEEGTDGAIYVARVTAAPSTTAGAAPGEAISCTRSDLPRVSNCTARQLADANLTVTGYSGITVMSRPVASIEPLNMLYEPLTPEVLVGPAGLYVKASATTAQMLIRVMVTWAEFHSNQVA